MWFQIFKKVERFVKCCQHGKESFLTRKVKEISIPQCDGIQRTNIPRQFQLVKEVSTEANYDEELYPLVDVKHGKRHVKCYDFWDIFNSRAFDASLPYTYFLTQSKIYCNVSLGLDMINIYLFYCCFIFLGSLDIRRMKIVYAFISSIKWPFI